MEPLKQLLAFALVVETSAMLLPRTAAAEPDKAGSAVSLSWVRQAGSEDCADASTLAKQVEQRRGATVFVSPSEAERLIEGRVMRAEEGYRAELRVYEAGGALLGYRDVVSRRATCHELSEAVAMVLAVMLDPQGAHEAGTAQEVQPARAAERAPVPAEASPLASAEPSEADQHTPAQAVASIQASSEEDTRATTLPHWELGAFARYANGIVPGSLWGGGVALDVRFSRGGGARLEIAAFAEERFRLAVPNRAGSDVRVLAASAQYCPLWGETARFRAAACLGLTAGTLQSRSFGFAAQRDSTSALLDASASLRGTLRLLGPVRATLGTSLAVPLLRTQLEATESTGDKTLLLQQPSVSLGMDVGLSSAF